MSIKQGFFSTTAPLGNLASKKMPIDLGQGGDSGFRAVAAAIINDFLDNPRAHLEPFKQIIEKHYKIFFEQRPKQNLLTIADKIKLLCTQIRMPELVASMAYTLRQIAVDEMLSNPSRYQLLLTQPSQKQNPDKMREVHHDLNEISLAALATRLQLAIDIHHGNPRQSLALSQHFGAAFQCPLNNPKLDIYKINSQFLPELSQAARFSAVKSYILKTNKISPLDNIDISHTTIQKIIADTEQQRQHEYQDIVGRLSTMFKANELSCSQLIALYIHNLNHAETPNTTDIIGTEYGCQKHFEQLSQTQTSAVKNETSSDYIAKTVIEAIAGHVALGQMNAKRLFDALEICLLQSKHQQHALN